jgi:predicted nucleotidyltransferase
MVKKKSSNNSRQGNDYLIASKFSEEIYPEFSSVIKSIIYFGSSVKNVKKKGDVDLLIVFNDSEVITDEDFKIYFNSKINEVARRVSDRIHLNIVTLTVFFQNLINSEPVVLNILRDGISIVDTGFFNPLKILLLKGDLKPTPEAIFNCATRVSHHMLRSKINLLSSVQELYLAMLDASQAMLMSYGQVAPSPVKIPELLKGLKVNVTLIKIFSSMQKLFKDIEYKRINELSGKEYDVLVKKANSFNKEMEKRLKQKI